jgi:3-phenylpropionate/trans-cinnamate dioxygenase ferredoxin reductase subunit
MDGVNRVLIVGGGQAGGEAAVHLRAGGFEGEITLVGEEPLPPYQRPPLSKKFLAGELPEDRLPIRPAELYEAENIKLLLGRRANWIDRANKRVRIDGGGEIAYDALILATGARPRALPIPGADLDGVHLLRTAADVHAIRPRFHPGAKLAVIGAGFIGLEVAAVGRQKGLDVTVIEALPRPLARVTSPEVAGFFLDYHTARGVRFSLGGKAAVFKGQDVVRAVGLADGSEVPADLVIVGAGIVPEVSLAETAGLAVKDGIRTDRATRSSDQSIFAIGDCARRPLSHYGREVRLESVHNAIEGAKIAAATILGQEPPAEELPWFWSDQYDLKLTIAGLFEGYDHIIRRGSPAEGAFAIFYYKGDRMLAVDAVNRPAEYLGAKQVMQRGRTIAPALLQDMSKSMKDIVAASR